MLTDKIKAVPVVAKVLSRQRTTINPQQQEQMDTQDQPSFDASSEPKEKIPATKEDNVSQSESENGEAPVNRRRKPYVQYMSTVKTFLAVLVVCALFGMVPLYRRGQVSQDTSVKVIMLWNEDPQRMAKGSAHMECGCVVTSRRKHYERAVDAFVFNAHRPYSLGYLPNINRTHNFLSVFAARNPLSLAKDPPPPPVGEGPAFNLTMTYRLDSQLVWSEYYFSLVNQAKRVNSFRAPSEYFSDDMPDYTIPMQENQKKTKSPLAMYLIYEVNEASQLQSLYLMELRNYVKLDAYKSCVDYEHCSQYHFMLIFDSTACPDYVPPQMYEAMYKFVVPVLIGGGNLSHLVPPHSYISSRDFPNPKDLAAKLKHLKKTPEEYKRYFWWHSLYKVRRTSLPYCQLCSYLKQSPEERRIETSSAMDFADWWTTNQCPKQITTFL